jgi:hypothetical protein
VAAIARTSSEEAGRGAARLQLAAELEGVGQVLGVDRVVERARAPANSSSTSSTCSGLFGRLAHLALPATAAGQPCVFQLCAVHLDVFRNSTKNRAGAALARPPAEHGPVDTGVAR